MLTVYTHLRKIGAVTLGISKGIYAHRRSLFECAVSSPSSSMPNAFASTAKVSVFGTKRLRRQRCMNAFVTSDNAFLHNRGFHSIIKRHHNCYEFVARHVGVHAVLWHLKSCRASRHILTHRVKCTLRYSYCVSEVLMAWIAI